jgi:hypothetical protein
MYVLITMHSLKLGTDYIRRAQHGWFGGQRGTALAHWHSSHA